MEKENIKTLWEQINCEACWNKDINTCFECENQCRRFNALKEIIEEKENLIKYLEDKIKYYQDLDSVNCNIRFNIYTDLLERVKSGKYE